jgi:hypothetical protein
VTEIDNKFNKLKNKDFEFGAALRSEEAASSGGRLMDKTPRTGKRFRGVFEDIVFA